MNPALIFTLLLFSLFIFVSASPAERDFGQCERIVGDWARTSLEEEVIEDSHKLRDLVFFLHVPRTGGRTYFHCLVKRVFAGSLECPGSYDKFRFDTSKPKCRYFATHDDFSVISKLPREKTSVITVLRDPVERVFSAYEFSVEVASRFLVHPNLTSATEMIKRIKAKHKGVSTLDIWPWKYLVPWMREDVFARRDARRTKGVRFVNSNNPYDVEEMIMPLKQFLDEPITWDLVHNGATFQVAGLTNNSYSSQAHEVRHCVQKFTVLGEHVLQVAQKRLDNMLFLGLTEKHRESAKMFSNLVGAQVMSQIASDSSKEGISENKSEQNSLLSDSALDSIYHVNGTLNQKAAGNVSAENEGSGKNMTVENIMKDFDTCVSNLRKAQSSRRTSSLKKIAPANLSKETRLLVPEATIQRIRSLNSLDLRLFQYAEEIYAKQNKHGMHKLLKREGLENMFSDSNGGIPQWHAILLATSIVFSLFLCVNAGRRRTSKVKI